MKKQYTIAEACHHLSSIVHELDKRTIVELTRRGKPVAVLMSSKEYQQLQTHNLRFWDAFSQFHQSLDLDKLGIEPEMFTELRDPSSGREINT